MKNQPKASNLDIHAN